MTGGGTEKRVKRVKAVNRVSEVSRVKRVNLVNEVKAVNRVCVVRCVKRVSAVRRVNCVAISVGSKLKKNGSIDTGTVDVPFRLSSRWVAKSWLRRNVTPCGKLAGFAALLVLKVP